MTTLGCQPLKHLCSEGSLPSYSKAVCDQVLKAKSTYPKIEYIKNAYMKVFWVQQLNILEKTLLFMCHETLMMDVHSTHKANISCQAAHRLAICLKVCVPMSKPQQ